MQDALAIMSGRVSRGVALLAAAQGLLIYPFTIFRIHLLIRDCLHRFLFRSNLDHPEAREASDCHTCGLYSHRLSIHWFMLGRSASQQHRLLSRHFIHRAMSTSTSTAPSTANMIPLASPALGKQVPQKCSKTLCRRVPAGLILISRKRKKLKIGRKLGRCE